MENQSSNDVDSRTYNKPKLLWWVLGIIILGGISISSFWVGRWMTLRDYTSLPSSLPPPVDSTLLTSPSITPDGTSSGASAKLDPTADMPAKDSSTEGWKIYTNKEFGFSFEAPSGWTVKKVDSNINDNPNLIFSKIHITSSQNNGYSLNNPMVETGFEIWDFPEKYEKKINTIDNIIVNRSIGIPRPNSSVEIKYVAYTDYEGATPVDTDKYQKTFSLIGEPKLADDPDILILDQILSTFKFTK